MLSNSIEIYQPGHKKAKYGPDIFIKTQVLEISPQPLVLPL